VSTSTSAISAAPPAAAAPCSAPEMSLEGLPGGRVEEEEEEEEDARGADGEEDREEEISVSSSVVSPVYFPGLDYCLDEGF